MDKQVNDIGKPFMEVVTNNLEQQNEKIVRLEERINNLPDHSEDFAQVLKELFELKTIAGNISVSEKGMQEPTHQCEAAQTTSTGKGTAPSLYTKAPLGCKWTVFIYLFLFCIVAFSRRKS